MSMIARLNATDDISLTNISSKAFLVANTLPRLKTDKWTTFFVWRPDTKCIGIVAVNAYYFTTVLVAQCGFRYLIVFYQQCIMCKSIVCNGHYAGKTMSSVSSRHTVSVHQF